MKTITDASVFEFPLGRWVSPVDVSSLHAEVVLALQQGQAITLRAGGTSLGGQAIGSGVVLDVSKYLTHILEYQPDLKEVTVEPGVIQDDLNRFVAQDGLRFAPDTSTSNRAMIGGMIGNNSCGSYSVYYGTTREHVKSVEVILSDGTEAEFTDLTSEQLHQKLNLPTLEGDIYRKVIQLLEDYGESILTHFPDESIVRRNTGYALDVLYRQHQPFNPQGKPFNLTPLICGSEGTLAVIKMAKLNLVDLPKHRQLICAHFESVRAAMEAVPDFLAFNPAAIELIDKPTLDGTQNNREQAANRFWIEQDPEAVLVIEFFDENLANLQNRLKNAQAWLFSHSAYACPMIRPEDSNRVWAIRKAGLGLLMGKPTREKAVAVIEDAAVPVMQLPNYYEDVQALMAELGVNCVYYGHASVGLIHIRPELDLATPKGKQLFQTIAERNAQLVKKYRGAISGEHGDGRIRAPFIKEQVGDEVYECLVQLKQAFDPKNLLNPGVIMGEMSITQNWRADRQPQVHLSTGFDWSADLSLMDAVEKCNGAGACRKSASSGGGMCPSYQATREENYSTRGRSNLLRFALTESNPKKALAEAELQEALSLCLSCKACHTECPASVDMASLKAEVLYQVAQPSLKSWLLKHYGRVLSWSSRFATLTNWVQNLSGVKKALKVDLRRKLPETATWNLQTWWQQQAQSFSASNAQTVWVLCDLYSQYQEPEVGQAVLEVMLKMGVQVKPIFIKTSPRALISQGLLDEAKQALKEIEQQLAHKAPEDAIVGIEPSELLVWRDEAPKLLKNAKTAKNTQAWAFLLFEEWVLRCHEKGQKFNFVPLKQNIKVHVHCHQKSLAQPNDVIKVLNLIPGQEQQGVEMIQTGCCGMAGDFGYEHYDVSVKIAEQALLPALEAAQKEDLIVATGTSCRHQIADLTERKGLHCAQVFNLALLSNAL